MQLDDTYNRLDHRLTQQLDTVRVNINTIHDASVSSVNDICTYAALTFTVINSIFLTCLLRKFWNPIHCAFHYGALLLLSTSHICNHKTTHSLRIYYSKVEPLVVVDFRFISVCILACIMSREFTRDSVTKFLLAQFP